MAWDRNDWLAFILVVSIIVVSLIVAIYFLWIQPGTINAVFEFKKETEQLLLQLIAAPAFVIAASILTLKTPQ